MPIGPGKHDRYCTLIREETGAPNVIVITLDPDDPSRTGFSVQADMATQRLLPELLIEMARQIRRIHEQGEL